MTVVLAWMAVVANFDIAWKDEQRGIIFDKLRGEYEVEERKDFLDERVFICTSTALFSAACSLTCSADIPCTMVSAVQWHDITEAF